MTAINYDNASYDFPRGSVITAGDRRFLTLTYTASTLTVTPWRWWHTAMRWNPCNDLPNLYGYE